jgi:predicted GIY-YIG superfamily endonuclease
MGCIYIIESPNGKSYIGQTIKNAEKRWIEHLIDAKDPKKIIVDF